MGLSVGTAVGSCVGASLGSAEGACEGAAVGSLLGTGVGPNVKSSLGICVGHRDILVICVSASGTCVASLTDLSVRHLSLTSLGSPSALQWAHAWEPHSAPLNERAKALLSGLKSSLAQVYRG